MRDLKGLTPADHVALIWKRKWYLVIAALLVVALGITYALMSPRVYKSEVRLRANSAIISTDYIRPTARVTSADRTGTILDQVQSRTFIESRIQEFQLFGYGRDPSFVMDTAVIMFRQCIQVLGTSENTFSISFMANTPELARAVTRRVADILIQTTDTTKQTKALSADQFVDDQLRRAEEDLKAHEEKIKQFKYAHIGELPEDGTASISTINQLRSQLSIAENGIQNAQDQRKLLDIRLQEQIQMGTRTASGVLSSVQGNNQPSAAIQQLITKKSLLAEYSGKYMPRHPDVIRLQREVADLENQIARSSTLKEEKLGTLSSAASDQAGIPPVGGSSNNSNFLLAQIRAEIESRDREIERLSKDRDRFSRQIVELQSRLGRAPVLQQELQSLNREYDVLKQQYSSLQNTKFSAQLTARMETSKNSESYSIIDEASLPERPIKPSRTLIVLISIVLGVCVGLAAAYGRELLDTTIGGTEDVKANLGLPVLALIPEISSKSVLEWRKKQKLA